MIPGGAEDPRRTKLRAHLEAIRSRARQARPWADLAAAADPAAARRPAPAGEPAGTQIPTPGGLGHDDLEFLAHARDDVLVFTVLGTRLLDLHQPRDAGGITSDPANPILRCRNCMWRWPCPTFRVLIETLGRLD